MKSRYSSFIKLFISIVIVSSALLIQGCSKSEIENLDASSLQSKVPQNTVFRVYDKTYNTPTGLHIWEAQLNKAIEMDSNMVRNGLKLIRYEHFRQITTINDFESVKAELKNDNSSFIAYENNSSRFSIRENKVSAANHSNLIDSLLPTSAGILQAIRSKGDASLLAKAAYAFKKNDLGVVNLVWEYNGKTLNTQCLVSTEKGIVYDKFLFSIHTTVCKITNTQRNSSKAPSILSKVPQIDHVNGDPVSKNFHSSWISYDYWGDVVAQCWVDATIYGTWYDGFAHVENYSLGQYASSICLPWNYASFIAMTAFSPTIATPDRFEVGILQFAYGMVGGYNVGVEWTGYHANWSGDIYLQEGTYITLLGNEMD